MPTSRPGSSSSGPPEKPGRAPGRPRPAPARRPGGLARVEHPARQLSSSPSRGRRRRRSPPRSPQARRRRRILGGRGRKPAGTPSSARSMRGLTAISRPSARARPPRRRAAPPRPRAAARRTTWRLVTASPSAIRNAEPTMSPFTTVAWWSSGRSTPSARASPASPAASSAIRSSVESRRASRAHGAPPTPGRIPHVHPHPPGPAPGGPPEAMRRGVSRGANPRRQILQILG